MQKDRIPETAHPPPLAERSLRRHTPEVGAVCGKAARTVLCGGRAMKRASLPLRADCLLHLLTAGNGTSRRFAALRKLVAIGAYGHLVSRTNQSRFMRTRPRLVFSVEVPAGLQRLTNKIISPYRH